MTDNERTMLEHYKDKTHYGELYQETGGKTAKQVPNILAIPLVAVRLFELHKKGKMPHECLNLLLSHINKNNDSGDKTEWSLIRDWLITAAYCDAKKRKKLSVVGIDIEGVTCNDDEVREWIKNRLDETIGPCRKPPTPQAMPPPQMATPFATQNVSPQSTGLAADIGRAIGLALRTLSAPLGATPTASKDAEVVHPYTRDEYGLLMAFVRLFAHATFPASGGILQPQR